MNLKSTKPSGKSKRISNLIKKTKSTLHDSNNLSFNLGNVMILSSISVYMWEISGFVSFMVALLTIVMFIRLSSNFFNNVLIIIFGFFPILLLTMSADFYSNSKDYPIKIKKIEINPAKEKIIVETTLKQKPYISFKMKNPDDFYYIKDNIKKAKFKIKMVCEYDTYTRMEVNTKKLDLFENPLKNCSYIEYSPIISIYGKDYPGNKFRRIELSRQKDKYLKLN